MNNLTPCFDSYGLTKWNIKLTKIGNILHIGEGSISSSDGIFAVPSASIDLKHLTSITIVRDDDKAYYVLWQPDCIMEGEFTHMLELVWKEGDIWYEAKDEDSRADY